MFTIGWAFFWINVEITNGHRYIFHFQTRAYDECFSGNYGIGMQICSFPLIELDKIKPILQQQVLYCQLPTYTHTYIDYYNRITKQLFWLTIYTRSMSVIELRFLVLSLPLYISCKRLQFFFWPSPLIVEYKCSTNHLNITFFKERNSSNDLIRFSFNTKKTITTLQRFYVIQQNGFNGPNGKYRHRFEVG